MKQKAHVVQVSITTGFWTRSSGLFGEGWKETQ